MLFVRCLLFDIFCLMSVVVVVVVVVVPVCCFFVVYSWHFSFAV